MPIAQLLIAVLFSVSCITQSSANFETDAEYFITVDNLTGIVLNEKNIDTKMFPASLSKIMTAYIVFDAITSKEIALEDTTVVSTKAWSMKGSRMFLKPNEAVSIQNLLYGLIIQSGNDAAVALSEALSGTEEAFVQRMNQTAKDLGMFNSNFCNASGWPDSNHFTTPRDMMKLSRAMLQNYPKLYSIHSEKSFSYNNITQQNRNTMLGKHGVDGIKTGYTDSSMHGIVLSAEQNNQRIIALINGAKTDKDRTEASQNIVKYSFANFANTTLFSTNSNIAEIKVRYGDKKVIYAQPKYDVESIVNKITRKNIASKIEIKYNKMISAPVQKGQVVGSMLIHQKMLDGDILEIPLVASESVAKSSFFHKILENISILILK